jgi:hypothetical protein
MIDRTLTVLNLLIAGFIAGAVVCVVGVVAPWFGRPLTSADLLPVFFAVGLLISAKRLSGQVGAEFDRESVRLEGDRLRNDKAAADLEARQIAPQSNQEAPRIVVTRQVPHNTSAGVSVLELEERRPARWVRWQFFAGVLLDWAEARGGLQSGRLVGRELAFSDAGAWVRATDELARVGLAVKKVNGQATRLAGSVAEARAVIAGGRVEWTDAAEPPEIAPFPAGLRVIDGAPGLKLG